MALIDFSDDFFSFSRNDDDDELQLKEGSSILRRNMKNNNCLMFTIVFGDE